MKKILLFASALAGLFLAGSCQRENLEPVQSANTVTYTVTVPDALATKGIGDDVSNVNTLHYEVYRTAAANDVDFTAEDRLLYHKTATVQSDGTFKIDLELVNDQNFTVLFWAQVQEQTEPMAMENEAYNVADLTNVTLKPSIKANQVDYAAFSGVDFIQGTDALTDKTILLTRPVAQINLGTTVASLEAFYTDITVSKSSMTVVGLSNTFDVASQAASGTLTSTTEYEEEIVPTEKLTVNSTEYVYVGMNYVGFAPEVGIGTPVTVSYILYTTEGEIQNSIENVPVKPNYRTNIIGNLITSKTAYTIELDERWGGADLAPDAIYMAAALGGKVTLTEDLELDEPLEIKADMTLDLNGNTVTGVMTVEEGADATIENGKITNTNNQVSGITTNGNLTLNDVEIVSARHAVRVESGKVVINGGTYTVDPVSNSTLHALNVGDDNTEAEVIIKGGTFIGPKGTMADSGSAVNVRSGSKVTIEGGDFSGGKSKTLASGGTLIVKGGSFDQTPAAFVAEGYKAISVGVNYHVFPAVVADAATTANVTAVTESTADVATALNTDNGEATMFMWNDVAYIAKYGEVVITSSADDATTARGVVEGAAGLTSATVAEGIEVVGNRTFRKCANLETVVFPNTLTEIGPAVFQSCSNLANVTIPASVTTIGEGAFAECTSLTSINIPDGITRLEKDVLRNTGLVSIEIPASVNYIGTFAFRDCESLTEVKILSPEFTIEGDSFTNMAAPLPTITIYVVNAEMKAYLESKLTNHDKSYITVVGPGKATTTAGLKDALDNGAKIVNVAEGEYSFPASSVNAGTTIVCEPGTVFTGTSGLNINGSTVIGATFANEGGVAVSGTINGTFKDCTFVGEEALRWCYSEQGKDIVFENCVIQTDFRGFHFDDMKGNVVFKNCEINGFNAYGGEGTATFENCTFGNDESRYNGLNIYSNTVLKNCSFVYVSGKTNFIDMEGTGKTLTIENCTATLDGAAADINDFVGGSKRDENTVIIK